MAPLDQHHGHECSDAPGLGRPHQHGGFWSFLAIQLSSTLLAAAIGVWLFCGQHQFENTYCKAGQAWSFQEAALFGSPHSELPRVLRWFAANIGLHHIHHLCSRVPFHRLAAILAARPELAVLNRIGLAESLKSVRLVSFATASSAKAVD